jgi:hypothetical protein
MQTILVDSRAGAVLLPLPTGFPNCFVLAAALEDQLLSAPGWSLPGRAVHQPAGELHRQLGAERLALPSAVYASPADLGAAGKRVFPHVDGQLCVAPDLARVPFAGWVADRAPEGGSHAMQRAAFPDKVLWANPNVGLYALPPADLRRWVRARVRAAARDGRGLAFEISEDRPANWREAIPVVLETLTQSAEDKGED